MNMKKYLAQHFVRWNIVSVDVERETKDSYWVNGARNLKISNYGRLFDSFDSAKQFLLDRKRYEIELSIKNTQRLSSEYDEINKQRL